MTPLRYLAYGSNLHPERLRRRTPSAVPIDTCALRGWRLSFEKRGQDGSGKATIVETGDPSHLVHGVVYEMHAGEKPVLDRIEGLNRGYREHVLSLPGHGTVWTYRAELEHTDRGLLPFCWYRELVLAGARHHGFPPAYIAAIEALGTAPDPDATRREAHEALLDAIRRLGIPGGAA